MLANEIGKVVEIPLSAWGGDRDEMSKVYGFDHQIQDRVEQETVIEREKRETGVSVVDEGIRLVTGERVKTVKCDCKMER
jgi:hypothetical protein